TAQSTPVLPSSFFFGSFFLLQRLPTPTLFPYTTLFRSLLLLRKGRETGRRTADSRRAGGGPDRRQRGGIFPRRGRLPRKPGGGRSEEHTSELQSRFDLVCRLLLEKKKI